MKKIPLYTMYEHNKAFYIWNKMVHDGAIEKSENFLLHIDHHDDMCLGGYVFPINMLRTITLEQAKQLSDTQLGIAEFIVPAIFEGLFNEQHFLQSADPVKLSTQKRTIYTKNTTELYIIDYIPFIHGSLKKEHNPDYAFFDYHLGGLTQEKTDIYKNKSIVCDVDLDYFCWDDSLSTRLPKRIEITEQAWHEYQSDPYHPFRIIPKMLMTAIESDGKYYLEYSDHIAPERRPSNETIEKRMDTLLTWLRDQKVTFRAIDICSSHYSGYLPKDLFPWIQELFLKKLNQYGYQYEQKN